MRYEVRLRIGYRYDHPAKNARHVLRISPRADRGQSVERLAVELSPRPLELSPETDFFGNSVDHLRIAGAHGQLSIDMRATVRVERGPPSVGAPTIDEIAEWARGWRDAGPASPVHHLGPSPMVAFDALATAFAAALPGWTTLAGEDAILALARAIQARFVYETGSTLVHTDVRSVMAQRRGVCQDFAHVMIAALRGHGVPAAYASGIIRTEPPPGQPRLEGADAMHAFVDVWLGPQHGWVGFDPTNGCRVLDDHVIVALGRDYGDIAPVDGVFLTAGSQSTWHCVDIVPTDD